ncbi:MAG: hypothetical protein WED05_00485 [Candidatus Atabeyarchaeum deiterrae]
MTMRNVLLRAIGVPSFADAAKVINANPTKLGAPSGMLCKIAQEELKRETKRENRMESVFEGFLYVTLILVVITAILVLFSLITEPIASAAMALITGTATAFYFSRLKDQRKLTGEKERKVKEYCERHKIVKRMLLAKMPSEQIVRMLGSE